MAAPEPPVRTRVPWLVVGVLAGLLGWFAMYGAMMLLMRLGVNPFLGPLFYVGFPVLFALGLGPLIDWASTRTSARVPFDRDAAARVAFGAFMASGAAYLIPLLMAT